MRRTIDRSKLPPSNPLECRDKLPKFRRSWERLGLNLNRSGAFKTRLKEVAEQDAKTQRRGKSWKPLTPGGRSTISMFHGPQCGSALTNCSPRYTRSAKTCPSLGKRSRKRSSKGTAPWTS
jgi:hypothetical protein